MNSILEVKALEKKFKECVAVDGISFSVPMGICFGLLGPNGAGKTTTIEMLEGIVKPSGGEIIYHNFDDAKVGDKALYNHLGIQFQHTALQDFLTVAEVLDMFAKLYPKTADINELIEICDLQDFLDQDHRKLSGGQKQRMLLAVAMINDPQVIFLDEPTTGLDPHARRQFWKLIERVKKRNKTIILTTHYMDEAQMLCDEIVIMDRGKIIAKDSPDNLLAEHFDSGIIRLPVGNFTDVDKSVFQYSESNGFIDITTNEIEFTISQLIHLHVSLQGVQVKTPNLDDLFLKLTGSQLGES